MTSRPKPPLVAVRAFEAVARHRSVRKAALATHTSHTVVSRHVRNLESWLGVSLLQRSARGVTLTGAGEDYFQAVSAPLEQIDFATSEIRRTPRSTALRVWMPPAFLSAVCLPRLMSLREAMLPTEILLRPALQVPDAEESEVDVQICWERSHRLDSVGERLAQAPVFPVIGGALKSAMPRIRRPEDLLQFPLLHEQSRILWRDWFQATGVESLPELTGIVLGNGELTLQAARLGQGVAISNPLIAAGDLASGQMHRLFDLSTFYSVYYFKVKPGIKRSSAFQRLRAWLLEAVQLTQDARPDSTGERRKRHASTR